MTFRLKDFWMVNCSLGSRTSSPMNHFLIVSYAVEYWYEGSCLLYEGSCFLEINTKDLVSLETRSFTQNLFLENMRKDRHTYSGPTPVVLEAYDPSCPSLSWDKRWRCGGCESSSCCCQNWQLESHTLTHHIEDDTISENHEEGNDDFCEVDHGYDEIQSTQPPDGQRPVVEGTGPHHRDSNRMGA